MKQRINLQRSVTALVPALAIAFCAATPPSAWSADKPPASTFREGKWDELIPPEWAPMKRFQSAGLSALSDSNPGVLSMMCEMRTALDNAPTNPKVDGVSMKLPGYVVPLEESAAGMSEFLLVPYFGACIHVPPPPANQIIHVVVDPPITGYRSMEAVWVGGTLKAARLDSALGTSGYEMRATLVDHYIKP